MLLLVLIFVTAFLAYWLLYGTRHPVGFPPGPKFSLPILGNGLDIGSNLPEGFEKLRQEYGNIYGLFVGKERAVVVSDFDLIQEVGASLIFSNRQHLPVIAELRGGFVKSGNDMTVGGIVGSNGPNWVEQRRYALHTLRNLGFGKNTMEGLVSEEVLELCKWLESFNGESLDIKTSFNMAVQNSLWMIVSSERMDYHHPKIQELVYLINIFFQEVVKPTTAPIFMYKPLFELIKKIDINMVESPKTMRRLLEEMNIVVTEHEQTFQADSLRDFIDHYLLEMKEKSLSSEDSSFKGKDGKLNLLGVLMDFFIAGSETTSTTLNWAMLHMLMNPDIQKKVQEELDQVTERRRLPRLDDRANTPYTEAVIHEIQRCSNIAPLAITHTAAEDAYLGKYFIPKGTWIFPNLGHIHMDPETFPDPTKFDPMRFINKAGKFEMHPRVIPFGVGKRRCIGENLAKMSLYLFFGGLMSKFNLEKASEDQVLTTDRLNGMTVSPMPYKLRFIARD